MAKYTTQVRTLVENKYDIFDFEYPIFDEKYRGVLEQNIINHYYFREIGFETVGQFKHFLKTWFQLEMPYYNRLYETEFLITKNDYMINLDNKTTRTVKTDQDTSNTSEASGSSKAKTSGTNTGKTTFSDTPQARLQGEDYATSLTEVDDSNSGDTEGSSEETATNTGKLSTIEEYQEHFLGNASMRYNADILEEWKSTWRNIDKLIIEELNQFFMNIY
jgi:hypothetical protein